MSPLMISFGFTSLKDSELAFSSRVFNWDSIESCARANWVPLVRTARPHTKMSILFIFFASCRLA
jgi:hypothetical protein